MNQKSLLLTVKQVIKETPTTITIVFDVESYSLKYRAGQFLTLIVPIGNEKFKRSYSLCTSPYTDALPAITVKRVLGGKVSNYLNDYIKARDKLEVLPPSGNFVLPAEVELMSWAVFIGGGSGITPLFSMIKAVLYQVPTCKVLLIYTNRDEESIIYKKALSDLVGRYGCRIQVVHMLSRPLKTWIGLHGRLSADVLLGLLKEVISDMRNHYFLCGPSGLIEMARTLLLDCGVDGKYLHRESFTKPVVPKKSSSCELTIHYEGEKNVCNVAQGDSLLDAALDNGVDIPFSCSSGMCNTCRAKCTAGKVRMLEDEGLTEKELEQGYILTCVAHPTTEKVVIEVD